MWTDRRILDLFGIDYPIVQAPMAGSTDANLAIAVALAGGLGSQPCATLSLVDIRRQFEAYQQQTSHPLNANFFCYAEPADDPATDARWLNRLKPDFQRHSVQPSDIPKAARYSAFNHDHLALLDIFRPKVVSFHFGLPEPSLVAAVKALGCVVISSATTVAEARWLQRNGCDAIIAQGAEAGGHRGIFLSDDIIRDAGQQPGTMALVPQVVDAVSVPVIAAGGIADGRGIAAALMLGASAVQVGTAYLSTPEAKTSAIHRAALRSGRDDQTAITNVLTGRPARGLVNHAMATLGPLTRDAPDFPLASKAIGVLRAKAEAAGAGDYSSLWAGQAVGLSRELPAGDLTRLLVAETQACFGRM
jgi:nitronate monooxygenase